MLLALPVAGQGYVTKSGTTVVPAPRIPAQLDATQKNATYGTDPTAGTFIIVIPSELREAINPLLRWKNQQGFRVEVLCPTTHQRDTIRDLLIQRYTAATPLRPAQRFVLLVGDVDRIQAFVGSHTPSGLNSSVTDLYYGEYTGDYLPEAQVGRLSVADSAELVGMVDKIIAYEQGRWAAEPTQLLLTAGKEQDAFAQRATNGQVNYLSRLAATHHPDLDTVCFRNPESDSLRSQVVQALRGANSLVNYTAHCTRGGWHLPTVTFHTIDSIDNPVPTLYVNNCCLSNAYDGLCFGEELLRRPTGGAAGVLGASNETLWAEDYYWAVGAKYPVSLQPPLDSPYPGAFEPMMTQTDGLTLGAMLQAGCSAVTQAGSPFDAFYWETYNLLGDPSMTLFWGSPDTLPLSWDAPLQAGAVQLTLHSTPGTRVSVTQDSLLGTAMADALGNVQMDLFHALHGDSVTLTATRPGSIATMVTLPLIQPDEGRLAITSHHTDNTRLWLEVHNLGRSEAVYHRLLWMQDSSDRQHGRLLGNTLTDTLSLSTGNDTALYLDLSTLAAGPEPVLTLHLSLSDSTNHTYSILPLSIDLPNPQPQLLSLQLLNTDSAAVRTVTPGENYILQLVLDRPVDSASLDINGLCVSRHSTADSLPSLPFTAPDSNYYILRIMLFKDGNAYSIDRWLTDSQDQEHFENGRLDNYPWHTEGLYPWRLDSSLSHTGTACLRSGAVHDNQRSTLMLEVDVLTNDSIAFYYNVSSEANDWLYFYIDSRKYGFWSGNSGWKRFACPIRQGHHRLLWHYQKDASQSEREDCARLDDIQLPFCLWNAPYGRDNDSDTLSRIIVPSEETQPCFRIYPNPARGNITITTKTCPNGRHIKVFNTLGKEVDEIYLSPQTRSAQYNTQHLRLGVYYMVMDDTSRARALKLIVTR